MIDCDRDHCTAEERAVLTAAVTWYEDDSPFHRFTVGPLTEALEALLVARATKPETEITTPCE